MAVPRSPTAKQRAFAKARVEGATALESFRLSGYTAGKSSDKTITRMAQKLELNPAIKAEIERLQANHDARHNITVDTLLVELEDARQIAQGHLDAAAMVRATMGKAKITGHDRKVLEIKRADIGITINRAGD